jgi:hypothetical protein
MVLRRSLHIRKVAAWATIPNPWISASFFAWALLFAVWQPFIWWRAAASLIALTLGCWGIYLWWRDRRKNLARITESSNSLE